MNKLERLKATLPQSELAHQMLQNAEEVLAAPVVDASSNRKQLLKRPERRLS